MKGTNMVKKLIYSSFLVLLFQIALFAQFEESDQARDPQHVSTAEQLTEDLTTRLSLTEDQSDEIKEILIDYQENVATMQTEGTTGETDFNTETETQTEIESETQTDFETETDMETETDTEFETETETDFPTTDTEVQTDVYMEGDFTNDPHERANQAIEDVLNDSQKITWNVIKEAWWRDVNSRFGWDE
jgi:purine-binding chemotaxis protein CheW